MPIEIVIDNPKQLVLSHGRQGVIRYQDLNASYPLNKILDLLAVYDHQAVATVLPWWIVRQGV